MEEGTGEICQASERSFPSQSSGTDFNNSKYYERCGGNYECSICRERTKNRQMLRIILSSIRYLARQGLALRGRYNNEDPDDSDTNSGEVDSNFIWLLTRAEDGPSLLQWMKKSQDKFTSPQI